MNETMRRLKKSSLQKIVCFTCLFIAASYTLHKGLCHVRWSIFSKYIGLHSLNTDMKSQVVPAMNQRKYDETHLSSTFDSSMRHTKRKFVPETQQPSCKFPVISPFHPSVMTFFKQYPPLDCSGGLPSVVDVVGTELKINLGKVKNKLGLSNVEGCRYRSLVRKAGDDFELTSSTWSENFTRSIQLGGEWEDQLQVDCHHKGRLVSRSYLALVRKRAQVEEQRLADYHRHVKEHSPRETLSVLMVGMEGISKQNFIRSMPKTRKFILEKMKAIELKKFNKLGVNTFPNVIPLLTGRHMHELNNWTQDEPFDEIDHLFIWNMFKKAGYRTSVLLDSKHMTEFHHFKKGWSNPPFDFYPRAVVLKSESDKMYRSKGGNCMGDTPEISFHLDYWVQLASVYRNIPSTPYFGYGLMNRLTHDFLNQASAADQVYLGVFQELVRRKILNNTLLLVMGDHGERFGALRNTYNGMLENKMPTMLLVFPPWFKNKYPEVMKNLHTNANSRLTTFFDVHATLMDILYFTGNSRRGSPSDRGISLFAEIPANRRCRDAGIPLQYCLCNTVSRENIKSSPSINASFLVEGLLQDINSRTEMIRHRCRAFGLKNVRYIFPVLPDPSYYLPNVYTYMVTIETTPGDAVYEGIVSLDVTTKKLTISNDVDRLTLYRDKAECVDVSHLRAFCECY